MPSEFAKILSDVWFEVKVPRTGATKQRGVNDGMPHNCVPKHVQRAERRRIHDYQHEYRHHEMARPCFARGKTVRDRGHQAADHRDERGGDLQPFRASHFFAAHEVRSDVEHRERDRDKHSYGCERCEPAQDSNAQALLHFEPLKMCCRGACAKRPRAFDTNAPTRTRLILSANRTGAGDVLVDRGRVAGVGHFARASDHYFQRIGDCNLRVASSGGGDFGSFSLQFIGC